MNMPIHRADRKRRPHRRPARIGATLIDVAIGSMLLSVMMIPAIHMIGKSQSVHRRLANRATMLYEAEQMIENSKLILSDPAIFAKTMSTPINSVQKIAVSDGPTLVGSTRVSADTSMPTAQLVNIVVEVWHDTDGDAQFDANEQGETLQTQWAAP